MIRRTALTCLVVVAIFSDDAAFAQRANPFDRFSFQGGHSLPAVKPASRRSSIIRTSATAESPTERPLAPPVPFSENEEKVEVVPKLLSTPKPVAATIAGNCVGECTGGCGAQGKQCDCGCDESPSPVFNAMFGYDSWRGFSDGAWANFGLRTGFNLGLPLGRISESTGIGAQIGGSIGAYNLAGSDYRLGNQDQVTTQGFVTIGLFRNADADSHLSLAIVQDWMFNETYGVFGEDVVLDQWRALIGWSFFESEEIGVWGAWHGGSERRNVQNFGRVSWRGHNQLNLYWRHKWGTSLADSWLWIGVPERDRLNGKGSLGDYIMGAFATVPLSDRLSLYTTVNYMNQSATRGPAASKEDYWNISVGIAFYPWSSTRTKDVRGHRYAPRLPVASNGLFLVDSTQNF